MPDDIAAIPAELRDRGVIGDSTFISSDGKKRRPLTSADVEAFTDWRDKIDDWLENGGMPVVEPSVPVPTPKPVRPVLETAQCH